MNGNKQHRSFLCITRLGLILALLVVALGMMPGAVAQADGDNPVLLTLEAYENPHHSCPWVYTWDGTNYVRGNDIYSTARGAAQEYVDYYTLRTPLVAEAGQYLLQLAETDNESSYTDLVQLMAVDHATGVKIAADERGSILTYSTPSTPASAVDDQGNDVLAQIISEDGFKGFHDGSVVLDFSGLDITNGATLVLSIKGFQDDGDSGLRTTAPARVYVQTQGAAGNWVTRNTFNPRMEWDTVAADLTGALESSRQVRLLFSSCHTGKYHLVRGVGLETDSQAAVTITTIAPTSAIHSSSGDVLDALAASDNAYAFMSPGEQMDLAFPEPASAGEVRDFVLVSEGYYEPSGSFEIYTLSGGSWVYRTGGTFRDNYPNDQTRTFDMSSWLPANGEYKVRIRQTYTGIWNNQAGIDFVGLSGCASATMLYATNLADNSDITAKLSASDDSKLSWGGYYQAAGYRWVEVAWSDPPVCPTIDIFSIEPAGDNLMADIVINDPMGNPLSGVVQILQGLDAPVEVTFETLSTPCGGGTSRQLLLNGGLIGEMAVANNCTCYPGVSSAVFTGPEIAANYNMAGDNTWTFNQLGGGYTAWAKATIIYADGSTQQSCILDYTGTGCSTAYLCAGYQWGPLSGSADLPAPTTVVVSESYSDSTLPPFLDLTSIEPGSYVLYGTTSNGVASDEDSMEFTLTNEQKLFLGNTPPVADAGGPYSGDEGSAIALSGASASDLDGDPLTISWTVSDPALCSFDDASALNPDLTCADDGSFIATLTVSDGVNDPVSSDATVTVNNVAPTIDGITAPVDPVDINDQPVSVEVAFSDPGTPDTHDVTWDWGDDSERDTQSGVTSPAPQGHTYDLPGVYAVTVTVEDDDGGTATATYEYIVIYDPAGGFVTGGGWIMSPPGAYPADPSLTGKANFGFVSKYKKGADTPTGQTEFQFKAGDLNFHSSSYDWLVIAGANAKYKGVGTINGGGNYGFMLTATDAELTPSTDVDLFRIKIWDRDNGDEVVYDNKMGEPDDGYAGTEIGGGNIKIHKAK
jgi:hypothetical protein